MEYIKNYYAYIGYSPFDFEKALEAKKIFDDLSIISSHKTPQQWANQIKSTLQILIIANCKIIGNTVLESNNPYSSEVTTETDQSVIFH
ncbi:hypothetical protein RhiirA4_481359 [Rhizophagus irregularis]|uniref:Uncharacterized protein n=1 Tax=Rhizophagus irregularis TaxID=588596 RepID=A0A2I1HJF1_9GLOM|nr:hypothetical protein RhiirA4_481359 [Rhizophagus irregularis]